MKNFKEMIFLIALVLFIRVFLFVEDYILVGPEVWMERSMKAVVYLSLFCMLYLGIEIFYAAFSVPFSVAIFLSFVAGTFIVFAGLGFRYRKRIWSLN